MIKLAIVIPYYKLTFFKETLDSLSNQTDKRFNVYIGNDASPENPEKLLQNYDGDFNVTYKKFKENLGGTSLVKQWERCINLTKDEEWLMILGDDDVLGDNVVEEFYKIKNEKKQSTNVIRYPTVIINENSEIIFNKTKNNVREEAYYTYYRKVVKETRSSLSEYIFRKESYLKYSFFDYPLAWCSDDRAVIEFSTNKQIYSLNNVVIKVRISNQSISGNEKNTNIKFKTVLNFRLWYYLQFKNKLTKTEVLNYLYYLERYIKLNNTISIGRMSWFLIQYLKNFRMFPFLKFLRRFLLRLANGK